MYINYSDRNFYEEVTFLFVDKFLSKLFDPIVTSRIGKYLLRHRYSHNLPYYLRDFPNYDVNMARIVKQTAKKYKDLTVIDVGANIGDSAALIKSLVDVPILCIDGDVEYFDLLKVNAENFKNIAIRKVTLGEKEHKIRAKFVGHWGTSCIEKSNSIIKIDTLDNILKKSTEFNKSKFLKIDTDGYEGLILRGGRDYLKKIQPVIFFEYDPYFLGKVKDNGLKILEFLYKLGYIYALIYDNTGEYLCKCELDNYNLLVELTHSIEEKNGSKYFDICVFCKRDLDLFREISTNELKNWR
jgi:FkbM family methyltransferase